MNSDSAMGLYILITTLAALIVNIIFYRVVFKKRKRMNANAFSWLSSLGVMAAICVVLFFPFTTNIETGTVGGAIGFGLLMLVVILPVFWFIPTSFYTLVRAIFILITRKRERETLDGEIQEVELIEQTSSEEPIK